MDLGLVPPRPARRRVESKTADLEHARPLGRTTTDERAQAGEQLREEEGLHEIVVRTGVQPGDPILDAVTSRQHEHGRPDASFAQPPADLDAIEPGQHQIEHHGVVLDRSSHSECTVSGSLDVDCVPFLHEAAREQARHLELVLGDQDPHR